MDVKKLTTVLLCLLVAPGFAHPPGLSSTEILLNTNGLQINTTFAIDDIEVFVPMDADGDAEVTDAELDAVSESVAHYIASTMDLTIDGKEINSFSASHVTFDKENNAHIELAYRENPNHSIAMKSLFLKKLPDDHRQYVTVKDIAGKELTKKMLTPIDNGITYNLIVTTNEVESSEKITNSTFYDFLKLGIEHILTGYDHLLFLFSLLVVTRNFWPAIRIITFFTIAHSITLALAGLNIIEISGAIIEPLIAASIVYVGLENIVRHDKVTTTQRCILTFCFGLIHGFGFAGVLREMDISSIETGILVPLFSFNMGVEIGQITVAAIVLPFIWWLHRQEKIDAYLVPFASAITCVAGGYWLFERTVLS